MKGIRKREDKDENKSTEDSLSVVIGKRKRMANKQRSKMCRQRKKQYILELESKVNTLQAELDKLKYENQQLKNISGITGESYIKLIENEEYSNDGIAKIIKEQPEQFRLTMLGNAYASTGWFGEERK